MVEVGKWWFLVGKTVNLKLCRNLKLGAIFSTYCSSREKEKVMREKERERGSMCNVSFLDVCFTTKDVLLYDAYIWWKLTIVAC